MASENWHARALLAVGHTEKLKELWASSPLDPELAYLHLRSLISIGHAAITSGTPYLTALQVLDTTANSVSGSEFVALRIVSEYLASGGVHASQDVLSKAMTSLTDILSDSVRATNPRTCIVAGEFFLTVGALDQAHAAVAPLAAEHNFDGAAILINIFLRLDRPDLASQLATDISKHTDDAILPQILEARVNMALGGTKLQDALWAWEELVQTYAASSLLLTMMGICHLLQNNWVEAARLFGEATQMDPGFAEAHVNLVVASAAAGHADLNTLSAMWTHFPHHPFTENLAAKAASFDQAAAKYIA